MAIIDTTSNTLIGSIPATTTIGYDSMQAIAINPAGTRLYVTQVFSALMNVFDTGTNSEITTIPAAGSRGIAVHPSGSPVYACGDAGGGGNWVTLIDAATNTISGSIPLGPNCSSTFGLALNATGTALYVSCAGSGRVAVVDTVSNSLVTTFPVGFVPLGLQLTPDESRLYVANAGDNTVAAVDTSTNSVLAAIPVDDEPHAFGRFIGPDFVCGNGVTEPGEGCDDGNTVGGDGCEANCLVPHDSVVLPLKPITVKLKDLAATAAGKVKPKVGNVDYLPAAEAAAAHSMSVAAVDGDCPASTVGAVTFDGASSIGVEGGKTKAGELPLTVGAAEFNSPSALSPTRCTAVLTVTGPAGDTNATNNQTRLTIDVIDSNDF